MAIILGIETSCDDTGFGIYDTQKGLLANCLYSQIEVHNNYGGVVPEIASRNHIKKLIPLLDKSLSDAQIKIQEISAIAYTNGPGLNGALLVGATFANSLGFSLKIPTIPIHHLEGHILSAFIKTQNLPELPCLAVLVSGGHSQIIQINKIGNYNIIGDTLDDAAGEAFDKTAKMLHLPYPGGKHIAALAKLGKDIYHFPRPMIDSQNLNMSFSGLKTAVLRQINLIKSKQELNDITIANLAASIEAAIIDVIVYKIKFAIHKTNIKNLIICGGVSANEKLRNNLQTLQLNNLYTPPLELCTDNGAMIAYAGAIRLQKASYDYTINVKPRYPLNFLENN